MSSSAVAYYPLVMIDEVQKRTREVPPEELEAAIAEAVAAAKAAEKAGSRSSL